jgi:pimeloyl-ACP methyl ester carboxylesterase
MPAEPQFLDVSGIPIAVRHTAGRAPGIVWLGGYKSDMKGTKAEMLAEWAAGQDRAFLRFDYSGHGESGGDFAEGTISAWLAQSMAVFDCFTAKPQIVVASSMGAWIALRMAQQLRKTGEQRIAGLVLLAPAPDFTCDLVEPSLTADHRRQLETKGYFEEPSAYSDNPYIYTRALIEDGRQNRVMTGPIDTHCPIHIMQGLADADVPSSHALKLVSHLPADDVTLSLIPGGDHRLSRPEDLDMLVRIVEAMFGQAG